MLLNAYKKADPFAAQLNAMEQQGIIDPLINIKSRKIKSLIPS
ncbi:hypothetical protein S2091_4194 [Solimicrobium silvestre]|uniref:Uncharacterized protein n=1 Tax=Solimicrobium silvestre TaxID=2099400 RepID=A0A2S9GTS3_9BURK|nr:hypothetical protein S2091_4194 [Solimicrobium silvestre]